MNASSRRSASVSVGLLGALALSLTGCGHGNSADDKRCVNDSNVVVDDSNCRTSGSGSHWYYGGFGSRSVGSTVSGGSTDPNSTVNRNGLGSKSSASDGSSSKSSGS